MGLLSILRVADRGPVARRQRRTFTPGLELGPKVENLESRVVLSHAAAAVAAPVPNIDLGGILQDFVSDNISLTDINLEGVNYNAATGLLTATGGTVSGVLAGAPFTTDITNFALQLVPGSDSEAGCSVLDLELGPIDIDLLGLHVDTSPICLSITAFEGQGLLGDLLCGLAGGDLDILDSSDLLGELGGLLSGVFGAASPGQGGGGGGEAEDICDGECEILDLAIGPVDLNLLGVNVHLDNCDDGPVQICVSASRGEGLLGNLLCGLTNPNGNRFGLLKSLNRVLGDLA